MKSIHLAYCSDNQNLADKIQYDLDAAGIRFEPLTEQSGPFAEQLKRIQGPLLLIFTSNLLKNEACMTGLLSVVQTLFHQPDTIVTVADGRIRSAGSAVYEPAPTRIERMGDALHYMNHWQNQYLEWIGRESGLSEAERREAQPAMQRVHNIANEIGELLILLRDKMYFSWTQLTAGDYKLFFQQFDMPGLHDDYLMHQKMKAEEAAHPLIPPPGGPISFSPVSPAAPETRSPQPPKPEPAESTEPAETLSPPAAAEASKKDTIDPGQSGAPGEAEIRQMIKDAWLWVQNDHTERGLQVFQLALEKYPQHQDLRTEYLLALSRNARSPEAAERQLEILHDSGLEEAKSYDLMGEIALAKDDFLFAKYCWDRVLQIAPDTPGIYRKLGLLTSTHLSDYHETGIFYLQKALEESPQDTALQERLAELTKKEALPGIPPSNIEAAPESQAPAAPAETRGPDAAAEETEEREAAPTPSESYETETMTAETPPVEPEKRLLVLITGATSGIGRETALAFARNGHRLILTGRRTERLDALKSELETEYKVGIHTLSFDVRDAAAVQLNLENLPEAWREVDVLVNNAGLAKGLAPIHEGSLLHWDTMIDTNLKGMLYVTRCIAPGMVQRRKGYIVNIGSAAGKEVYPNGNVYCATKFGVDALTRAMRYDLYKYNIRVGQVSPGHVEETEFALTRFDGDPEKARIYDDFQPLKASDVAELIYFMVTRPAYVNIQDVLIFGTQQAGTMLVDRTGK